MADIGALRDMLKGIPDVTTRGIMIRFAEYLAGNLTFGAIDPDSPKAKNFQSYHVTSTTAAASTSEFTIAHGMDRAPQIAFLTLDLSQPGAKIVPIEVTRAADSRRLYLRSTSTGCLVSFLVE